MIINLLNIISLTATFAVAQIILFTAQNLIFGKLKVLNLYIIKWIKAKHLIFFTISTILLLMFTEFHLPYSIQ